MAKSGEEIELSIDSLASGSGVGRYEGQACFVEGALPGERVRACVTLAKKRYLAAKLVEIIKPSSYRESPPCPYVEECGGCQYQHISYAEELRWKEIQVRETLERIGKIKPERFESITQSPAPYDYRNSITLNQGRLGNKRAWGYFVKTGRSIISIDRCLIAREEINDALAERFHGTPYKQFSSVTLKLAGDGEVVDDTREKLFKVKFAGKYFWASSKGFFQINIPVAERMVEKVQSWIAPLQDFSLYDLYAGVGLFGILCGEKARSVHCVEANEHNTLPLRRNIRALSRSGYHIIRGTVESKIGSILDNSDEDPRVVILNPPREGLHKKVAIRLAEDQNIAAVVYISCDVASLARDLGIIMGNPSSLSSRYRLISVAPFDMFPRTQHIEVAALLLAE